MRYVVLFFFLGQALAQDNFIGRTLDAGIWLEDLEADVALYTPTIIGIARRMAALALVASVVMYALNPNPIRLFATLLRALVVSALIVLTPEITTLAIKTTEGLRNWSMDQLQPMLDEGADEMIQLGQDSAALVVTMTMPELRLANVASKNASSLAFRREGLYMQGFSRWLNLAVIPILVCVVIMHLMGLLALLSVAIANIIFPLASAMLMFSPSNGEKWLGNYISTVVSAMLVVLLLPLAFKVGFNIIVVGPVHTINENFDDFDERFIAHEPPEVVGIDESLHDLYAEQDAIVDACFAEDDPTCIFHQDLLLEYQAIEGEISTLQNQRRQLSIHWWDQVRITLQGVAEGLLADLRNWFLRLVLLLFGSIAASYLIWRVSSTVAGLVGGVALEAVHFASGPLQALSSTGRGIQSALRDAARSEDYRSPQRLSGPSRGGGKE